MSFVVSSVVEMSVNKIALWISVHVDDWTAELAITAINAVADPGSQGSHETLRSVIDTINSADYYTYNYSSEMEQEVTFRFRFRFRFRYVLDVPVVDEPLGGVGMEAREV